MKRLLLIILIFVSYVAHTNAEDFGVYCGHHDGVSSVSVAANESVAYSLWQSGNNSNFVAYKFKTKTDDRYNYEGREASCPGNFQLSVSRGAHYIITCYTSGSELIRSYYTENCRVLSKDEVSELMAEGGKM